MSALFGTRTKTNKQTKTKTSGIGEGLSALVGTRTKTNKQNKQTRQTKKTSGIGEGLSGLLGTSLLLLRWLLVVVCPLVRGHLKKCATSSWKHPFAKIQDIVRFKKKEPVDLGLAAPGNQRNTLLQAPLAETGSRPIRLISTSETQKGNRNTLFLIFTFPPGTPVHQEGYLEKLQQAHR